MPLNNTRIHRDFLDVARTRVVFINIKGGKKKTLNLNKCPLLSSIDLQCCQPCDFDCQLKWFDLNPSATSNHYHIRGAYS